MNEAHKDFFFNLVRDLGTNPTLKIQSSDMRFISVFFTTLIVIVIILFFFKRTLVNQSSQNIYISSDFINDKS